MREGTKGDAESILRNLASPTLPTTSPFTGQGDPPPGMVTNIYMRCVGGGCWLEGERPPRVATLPPAARWRPSSLPSPPPSIYVDRILYIDETKYTYEANFYIVLAWKDPRAQDEVQKATAASLEPGAECRRPCNGQKAPTPESRCCSSLYLPTILIRNVAEYPQGRSQAYTIRVEPDHTVMWRSEVRGMFYTTASYPSFPWDVQSVRRRGWGVAW